MRQISNKGTHYNISFDFNQRLVKAVKALPGHRWNPLSKSWTVPSGSGSAVEAFAKQYGFNLNQTVNTFKEEQHYDIPALPVLSHKIELKRELYPFQKQGVAYLMDKKRVLVGDSMGLGKTVEALASVQGLNAFPCLVICPASLKINWQREWETWTDKHAMILSDATKESFMTMYQFGMNQVFITNYESLKKYFVHEIKPSKKLTLKDIVFKQVVRQFKSVIIDESHRCKDAKTLQSKLTKGICDGKEVVFALSGTPLVNRPNDLIPQLSIINRLMEFGGYKTFVDVFCDGGTGSSNLKYLNFKLRNTCFVRRDKSEVLTQLPAKVRQVVYCEIDKEHRREYAECEADMLKYLVDYKNATDEKLKRAARGEVMVKIGILKNVAARGKLADVFEYIDDVMADGEKLIVFGHLKEVLGAVKSRYEGCLSITGDDSMEERQVAIDKFQKDPECKLIACSIKAAGVGITLTAASRVAFIEQWWTAADHEQCEDRCILKDEQVLTPGGWALIQDIKVGDMVIGGNGVSEKVLDAWSRGNTKNVTEVVVEGWGAIRTTSDHRFLVNSDGAVKWVEAQDLRPGMMSVMPRNKKAFYNRIKEISFDSDCRCPNTFIGPKGQTIPNGRLVDAPATIELTDTALFVFGYFAGDGFSSIDPNKGKFVSFSGHKIKKLTSVTRCAEWFKEQGVTCNIYESKTEECVEARAFSAEWAMFFRKHFGHLAKNKRLPEFLLNLSLSQSLFVLSGLIASDGYYRKGRYEYVTASNQLASQVTRLILRVGYRPCITKNSTGHFVVAYSESQDGHEALIRSVKTTFPQKVNGKREMIYDLTVENSGSFVVGTSVVHNCHRIGQQDSVQCTYFLGKDTIDEKIYNIWTSKAVVANTATGAKNDIETSVVDKIMNLFKV